MPLLMHEVWQKILLYAYEPKPVGLSGATREACRQNTLATLMRTSIVSLIKFAGGCADLTMALE